MKILIILIFILTGCVNQNLGGPIENIEPVIEIVSEPLTELNAIFESREITTYENMVAEYSSTTKAVFQSAMRGDVTNVNGWEGYTKEEIRQVYQDILENLGDIVTDVNLGLGIDFNQKIRQAVRKTESYEFLKVQAEVL